MGKPIYQRRIVSIARLLAVQWSALLEPPGFLMATDDGAIMYESAHPQEEGHSWRDTHLYRHEGDKGAHGTRSTNREHR